VKRVEPETYEFDPDQPWQVLDQVESILDSDLSTNPGWINFEPDVAADHVPSQPGTFALFSGRGPDIPFCTFTPGDGQGPLSIGIQHGTGPKAKRRLAELGLHPLDGWVVRSDHPKRGLVIEVPRNQPLPELLDWLFAAGEGLSSVPMTGRWHMAVYRP
jgi:hypothetical protein